MRKMTIVRDKTFYKSVLSIMFPVALQQAINMGVNMLDTMMLGSFGEVALSASSLANQYYNFFVIFNLGIIAAAACCVPSIGAQAIGRECMKRLPWRFGFLRDLQSCLRELPGSFRRRSCGCIPRRRR